MPLYIKASFTAGFKEVRTTPDHKKHKVIKHLADAATRYIKEPNFRLTGGIVSGATFGNIGRHRSGSHSGLVELALARVVLIGKESPAETHRGQLDDFCHNPAVKSHVSKCGAYKY